MMSTTKKEKGYIFRTDNKNLIIENRSFFGPWVSNEVKHVKSIPIKDIQNLNQVKHISVFGCWTLLFSVFNRVLETDKGRHYVEIKYKVDGDEAFTMYPSKLNDQELSSLKEKLQLNQKNGA